MLRVSYGEDHRTHSSQLWLRSSRLQNYQLFSSSIRPRPIGLFLEERFHLGRRIRDLVPDLKDSFGDPMDGAVHSAARMRSLTGS